jgi:cytochrome c-type biogenesis protein
VTGTPLVDLVLLPIGLGLIGFIEPCSLGSTFVYLKVIEGKSAAVRRRETLVFALTRGAFIGLLGVAAVLVGQAFLGFQRGAWILLGTIYVMLGAAYLLGRAGWLMRSFGPSLSRLSGLGGSARLGILFGLNIPACAAPLLLALLGGAAAGGAAGATSAQGFVSLGLFGLALSLPLVAAVFFAPARRMLDRLAGLSRRLPFWAGIVLALLGLWSIWFGLFVSIDTSP